ncbi:MAG: hypothetical protein KGH56_00430 [Patescibacteria group bacterium]|nr:hypothetical protein [Patescibacteria group bacterium]
MRKMAFISALLLLAPSISFAAPLTQAQAESLINVVQSSPGTPASVFTNLITAFSNITVAQAESLIGVVQAAPSVSASSFVNLLTSFTADTSAVQMPPQTNHQTVEQVTPVSITQTNQQITEASPLKSTSDFQSCDMTPIPTISLSDSCISRGILQNGSLLCSDIGTTGPIPIKIGATNLNGIIYATVDVRDACGNEYPYNLTLGNTPRIINFSGKGQKSYQISEGNVWQYGNDLNQGQSYGYQKFPVTLSSESTSTTSYLIPF